jgi:hypothetical protein
VLYTWSILSSNDISEQERGLDLDPSGGAARGSGRDGGSGGGRVRERGRRGRERGTPAV